MAYNQYVLFKLQEQEYAVDINKVKTIEKIESITRVPGAEDFVKGVINLRGEVIPVIDIRKRLSLGSIELNDESRIIIVKLEDLEVGMMVDSASEVVRIREEDIDKNPDYYSEVDECVIEGIGKIGDRIVVILDIPKVLKIA